MAGHGIPIASDPEAAAGAPPRSDGDAFLRAAGWISTVTGWIAAGMIVAAVAITCQMIFVRFVLNGSTVWQTEAVIYLMIGATLVGLAYVQRLRGHVNVDLVPLALPGRARRGLFVLTMGLSIGVVALMLWHGLHHWWVALTGGWRSDTVWGVRLAIPYAAIPIGFGLLMLQLVADLWAVLTGRERPFGLEER